MNADFTGHHHWHVVRPAQLARRHDERSGSKVGQAEPRGKLFHVRAPEGPGQPRAAGPAALPEIPWWGKVISPTPSDIGGSKRISCVNEILHSLRTYNARHPPIVNYCLIPLSPASSL